MGLKLAGKWIVEVWCTGQEGAAKVTVSLDHEPTNSEMAALQGSALGAYRRTYQEWPTPWDNRAIYGKKVTPPQQAAPSAPAPAPPAAPEAESRGA